MRTRPTWARQLALKAWREAARHGAAMAIGFFAGAFATEEALNTGRAKAKFKSLKSGLFPYVRGIEFEVRRGPAGLTADSACELPTIPGPVHLVRHRVYIVRAWSKWRLSIPADGDETHFGSAGRPPLKGRTVTHVLVTPWPF